MDCWKKLSEKVADNWNYAVSEMEGAFGKSFFKRRRKRVYGTDKEIFSISG